MRDNKKQKALISQIEFLRGQYEEIQKARDIAYIKSKIGKCYVSMNGGTNFCEFMFVSGVDDSGRAVVWSNQWNSTYPSVSYMSASNLEADISRARLSNINEIKKRFDRNSIRIINNFNEAIKAFELI